MSNQISTAHRNSDSSPACFLSCFFKNCNDFFNGRKVSHPQPSNQLIVRQQADLPIIEPIRQEDNSSLIDTMLSEELILTVFEFLNARDLQTVSCVSWKWNRLARDDLQVRSLILRTPFSDLRQIVLQDTQSQSVVPSLITAWRQGLQEAKENMPVINGLSLISIPEEWKNHPAITDEQYQQIQQIYQDTVSSAILSEPNLNDISEDNHVTIYHDNNNPPLLSKDFCIALCTHLKNREVPLSLTIHSASLTNDVVSAIASELQFTPLVFLHLYGPFQDEGVTSLTQMIRTLEESGNQSTIEILTTTCTNAAKQTFESTARRKGINCTIIRKSDSTLYDYP